MALFAQPLVIQHNRHSHTQIAYRYVYRLILIYDVLKSGIKPITGNHFLHRGYVTKYNFFSSASWISIP